MITSSREADFSPKLEGDAIDVRISKASSASTPWLRSKDPRIVRVSRTFGGKDRHSKVCTVRGLRDRRVRLSVPTAIQLYDLQDRLGLNQPSKVVDWLLDVAKHEIDELPPLQMPPGNLVQTHHHQPMITSLEVGTSQLLNKEELKISNGAIDHWEEPRSGFWGSNVLLRAKSKEIARENVTEKGNWMKRAEEKQEAGAIEGHGGVQLSSNTFPTRSNQPSLPSLLSTSLPYGPNPFYHLDPSNLSLSNLGSHGFFTSQAEDLHNFSVVPLSSSLSLTYSPQVLVSPPPLQPGTKQSSYFPPQGTTTNSNSMEFDPRQINHFQLLSSTSQNIMPNNALTAPPLNPMGQPVRPLHLSMAHKIQSTHPNKNN